MSLCNRKRFKTKNKSVTERRKKALAIHFSTIMIVPLSCADCNDDARREKCILAETLETICGWHTFLFATTKHELVYTMRVSFLRTIFIWTGFVFLFQSSCMLQSLPLHIQWLTYFHATSYFVSSQSVQLHLLVLLDWTIDIGSIAFRDRGKHKIAS